LQIIVTLLRADLTRSDNRLPSPQRGRGVWGWGGFHGDESAPRNHCWM